MREPPRPWSKRLLGWAVVGFGAVVYLIVLLMIAFIDPAARIGPGEAQLILAVPIIALAGSLILQQRYLRRRRMRTRTPKPGER